MQLPETLPKFVLASGSPRRQELLEETGLKFDVVRVDVDETIKKGLSPLEIVDDLARRKQVACENLRQEQMILTADTLVFVNDEILAKPYDATEARTMLKKLSNSQHSVTTSVCLGFREEIHQFNVTTIVHFKELTEPMIDYYIDNYQPFDKAGSYGIQEWLGHVGINRISGSYTNVVGLPVAETFAAIVEMSNQWKLK